MSDLAHYLLPDGPAGECTLVVCAAQRLGWRRFPVAAKPDPAINERLLSGNLNGSNGSEMLIREPANCGRSRLHFVSP
jgi:hypothetical protein